MKHLIAFAFLSTVALAESDNLSWFSTPEMTFENKEEQTKQETIVQPSSQPGAPERNKPRNQRTIRSIERIDATKSSSLPAELKKCRNVFRATIIPSSEDSQSAGIAMGLSEQSKENFKPQSLTIVFSTDPSCSQGDNRSPQFSSLLSELRQRAKASHPSGETR